MEARANSPKLLRTANQLLVLNAIMTNNSMTVEEIVQLASLSRPTVLEALKRLMADHLVAKAGMAKAEVGRQPVLYSIDTRSLFAMGVDVDYPTFHVGIADLAENMVYHKSYELLFETPPTKIADSMVAAIRQALDKTGLAPEQILGVGLGMPAIINIGTNRTAHIDKIPGWESLDIAARIQQEVGIKAYVHNDAHMLGLAEKRRLRLDGESFIYITHRTGIGSALFIDGELYDGEFGNSGYIGHMCIDAHGEECECKNHGCLELYCSRRAIIGHYNRRAKTPQDSLTKIYQLGDAGDAVAVEVLQMAGDYLGLGISNIVKLYDICRVVIGDMRCNKDSPFFISTVESLKRNTRHFVQREVTVTLGLLDEHSVGLSGCYYVLSNFLNAPKLRTNVSD